MWPSAKQAKGKRFHAVVLSEDVMGLGPATVHENGYIS